MWQRLRSLAIRLTGNVTGEPPFANLRHPLARQGTEVDPAAKGTRRVVLEPAEVELRDRFIVSRVPSELNVSEDPASSLRFSSDGLDTPMLLPPIPAEVE